MAVIDSNQTSSNNVRGFEKQIHRTSRTMMLDNLQAHMYMKPIQSCVRESVSNAVDSTKEKEIAIDILTGKATVSDYYVSKDSVNDKIANEKDDIYSDSEFNKSYYNLKYLNPSNKISLVYKTNSSSKRDQFIITDSGVGLGEKRLEGFFSLGYSSKRLNTSELGGFGLGAKSPLATGVESYRIISRHNGKEYCFDIYSHKVDCVYNLWNEDETQNKYYEFETIKVKDGEKQIDNIDAETGKPILNSDGTVQQITVPILVPYKAYYKETNEKNSLTILIDVKKHNRQQYFEAVKSQLLYLRDDIEFTEVNENDELIQYIPFKATILYEDEFIIIPETSYYSRPHFIIKNISYGLIDYNELDLTNKTANIGIKVKMEQVSVTPNRESVIYDSKTRTAVLDVDKTVTKIVETKIQDSLNQTDFLSWLRACNKIMFNTGSSSDVISRLSQLVDKSELKPKFVNGINFSSLNKNLLTPLIIGQTINSESSYNYRTSKRTSKIQRQIEPSSSLFNKPLYFAFCTPNTRTTAYLAGLNKEGYSVLRGSPEKQELDVIYNDFIENKISEEEAITQGSIVAVGNITEEKMAKTLVDYFIKTINLIKELKKGGLVENYSKINVPESFKAGLDENEEIVDDFDYEAAEEAKRKERYKKVLELRKENKAFIVSIIGNKYVSSYRYATGFTKREVKYTDFENSKLIYGTEAQNSLFIAMGEMQRNVSDNPGNTGYDYFWNDDFKIVRVAKNNLKFVKSDGIELSDFVLNLDNDTLKGCDLIRKILTAEFISPMIINKCNFLTNFSNFSYEIALEFKKLYDYYYSNKIDFSKLQALAVNCEEMRLILNCYEAQKIIISNPDLEEDEIQNIIDDAVKVSNLESLDLDIMNIDLLQFDKINLSYKYNDLDDVYGSILNYIEPITTSKNMTLPLSLEVEIRSILESRKDQLTYSFKGINE